MKICVTSKDLDLESEVDPRFGRCQYFLLIDTDSMNFRSINNDNKFASGGAGIQAAQLVINEKPEALLTGNIGPNAFKIFSSVGIKVYTGLTGKIKDAIEKYKKGELKETSEANVGSHHGNY
jgi:predicted Fe-Mo cluster-binding NifX family protein